MFEALGAFFPDKAAVAQNFIAQAGPVPAYPMPATRALDDAIGDASGTDGRRRPLTAKSGVTPVAKARLTDQEDEEKFHDPLEQQAG